MASIGGAGFALRAMGLFIPLVPPLGVDPGNAIIYFCPYAGGWLVGLLCGLLRGFPSGVPLASVPCELTQMTMLYVVWERARFWSSRPRWLVIALWPIVADFAGTTVFAAVSVWLGIVPAFIPYWPFAPGITSLTRGIVVGIMGLFVAKVNPSFMRIPRAKP